MTQTILPHKYWAQTTGWTCGPSTALVVLSTFGISVTEQQMAAACGTTTDGTADIANVDAAINARTQAGYTAQYIRAGNPTAADVTALREAIKTTIVGRRRAMPINIWAQSPTQPPGYPAELIMHYVTVVGYDDANDRAYVSDSARFSGIEHWWMSVDRLALNITPKGYGALAPLAPPPAGGQVFTALTPDQEVELYEGIKWIREQLDTNRWGPDSSMGRTGDGRELTVRDGLAALCRTVAAIDKKVK